VSPKINNRLPRFLAIAAVLVSILSIVSLSAILVNQRRDITNLNEVYFPLMERAAVSLRLSQKLEYLLGDIVIDNRIEEIENFKIFRSVLEENIVEQKELLKQIGGSNLEFVRISRNQLTELEDKVIGLAEKGRRSEAEKLIHSVSYLSLRRTINDFEEKVTESLSLKRERMLKSKEDSLKWIISLAVILIFGVCFLWVLAWRAYLRSVRERNHAMVALKVEQERNIQSAKLASLGEMSAGIAHEINNPLAIIIIKLETLKKKITKGSMGSDQLLADLMKVHSSSMRISKIVKGLRVASRDSTTDPYEKVKINTLVEDTIALCSERFKCEDIDLEFSSDVDEVVNCRPAEICQVLFNLLSNAHDAVGEQSIKKIHIAVDNVGDFVELSVEDSGHGVPDAYAERVFEPFFTTKDVGKGTGIGLSISKGIIEKHGGKLEYDPASAQTRFTIKLPRVNEEQKVS
jgi:C4-dicarboxylate-specific signal transduction histidine kinase